MDNAHLATGDQRNLGPCPLCGRAMIEGPSVDRHHWVPRTEGGREAVAMHKVCHRMVHRVLDERTLARDYATAEALRSHPEIQRFIAWVKKKPPDYIDWPKRTRRH